MAGDSPALGWELRAEGRAGGSGSRSHGGIAVLPRRDSHREETLPGPSVSAGSVGEATRYAGRGTAFFSFFFHDAS